MRREISYDEIHDGQRYFRVLLDSMAHPGRVNTLYELDVQPPAGLTKGGTLVALSLLNADVSFCSISPNNADVTQYLLLNTSASPTALSSADFIFINGEDSGDDILSAKTGTLPYPEEGASLIIDVESISENKIPESLEITVSGPGVLKQKSFFVDGLNEDILNNIAEMNSEFPLGVDAIFTDKKNNVVCIPRSNKVFWRNHQS